MFGKFFEKLFYYVSSQSDQTFISTMSLFFFVLLKFIFKTKKKFFSSVYEKCKSINKYWNIFREIKALDLSEALKKKKVVSQIRKTKTWNVSFFSRFLLTYHITRQTVIFLCKTRIVRYVSFLLFFFSRDILTVVAISCDTSNIYGFFFFIICKTAPTQPKMQPTREL